MKNKVFSFINVVGLAVSFSAFFLIIQYVTFELSYDQYHTNKDEIYRVALEFVENRELKNTSAKNFDEIRDILKEHLPQIEQSTGFVKIPANTGFLFSHGEKLFNELGGFLQADSNFFKVFPSLLIKGDPQTALDHPNNLVISESMAKKVFGDIDPLGQTIGNVGEVKEGGHYVVTGVLRDIPQNAHFHAKFIGVVNLEEWGNYQPWNWFFYTYVTIPTSVNPTEIREGIARLNAKLESLRTETKGARILLQPITDIHLKSKLVDELEANGNSTLIYVLAGIGLVILIIAWINYINLEAARFIVRAKDVAIRRVVGSTRRSLALQFLIESSILTILATSLATLILTFIFPYFSYITGLPISEFQLSRPIVWLAAFCLLIGGSVFVGVYPSFFIMKLNSIDVLKGKTSGVGRGRNLRQVLVVIQFTASVCLIAFVLLINQQLNHILLYNRKIDIDKVVAIRNPTAYMRQEGEAKREDFKRLQNSLLQHSSIKAVATSSAIPGTEIGFTYVDLIKRNVGDAYDPTRYKTLFIDYSYFSVYGLKILAGRNYNQQNGEDENWTTLILNEKAIHTLGFKSPEEALGQEINFMAVEDWDKYKIVGVVEDYHHEAVKEEVFPMIFFLNHNIGQQVYFSIKLNSGSKPQEAIADIEKSWKQVFPDRPLEYFFIDEYYDQQFKAERHFSRTFIMFAGIAIVVASLGILGITLFEANLRLKELSIRKVLGASVTNLIELLARDHIRILLISGCAATPLVYLFAGRWLANYPIRIEISPLILLISLTVLVVIVLMTSCFQTVKAANTNPVDHLKHE